MSTGYALAYRFGITPWERYGKAAASSIEALLGREEAERSQPLGRALDLGCGRGDNVPRDRRSQPQERLRRHFRGGRRDGPRARPGHVRLLLRRRLLPGPELQAASRRESGCLCTCQPGCDAADARLRADQDALRRGWRIEGGGRGRFPGLGDAFGELRGHQWAGVAAEQDSAAMVPTPPRDAVQQGTSCHGSALSQGAAMAGRLACEG